MKHLLFILFTICMSTVTGVQAKSDGDEGSLAWQAYAPVERMGNNNLHYVKTYFFDGNPNSQTPEDVLKLKQAHDSITSITIGKVFMSKNGAQRGDNNTWYWWSVKEHDKAYILAYLPNSIGSSSAEESYYVITFTDGTSYKWQEPHESPYNYHSVFILVDGSMQALDTKEDKQFTVQASPVLKNKFLNTPIHYITKYNGYASEKAGEDITYEPVLQYVFTEEESLQMKETLQVMLSNLMASN